MRKIIRIWDKEIIVWIKIFNFIKIYYMLRYFEWIKNNLVKVEYI